MVEGREIIKKVFNSEGFTLIEVLLSIVLLGVIFTAFFSFFSQSMMFSNKAEDQLSAVNVAEKVLYEMKHNDATTDRLSNQSCPASSSIPLSFLPQDSIGYYKEINGQKYYPNVTTCQSNKESNLGLYRVHVEIYDKDSKLLGEIFDYMNVGG